MAVNRRRRVQLRTRVLAGVLAVTIAAFAAFDAFAVTELRGYLVNRLDSTLRAVLTLSASHLQRLRDRAESGQPARVLQAGLGSYDYLAFVPEHGTTVVLDAEPGITPQLPASLSQLAARQRPVTTTSARRAVPLRLRAQRVDGGTLVATASLDDVNHTVRQLRLIVIAGSAAAVVLIGIGVAVVVRRGLRPLESMAAQADRINAGDLRGRVGPDHPGSEVGRLATALNGMLTRIETSVRERESDQDLMRRFFADASHELRTPLASLRANAELYEQGALRQRAQVDEAVRRIRLEAERMSRLVDDMLRLARLDQHPTPAHDPVNLTAILRGCVERIRTASPERTWHDDIAPDLATNGDEELIRRAVDNLLHNVCVHTPTGTTATVTARLEGSSVVIEITDDGPGVPADRLSRIFERFYRADTSAPRSGSGLGLAIVAETATAHQGSVTAALNYPRGLRLTLTLPATGRSRPRAKPASNPHGDPASL